MTITVIDGSGGGVGKQIVAAIKNEFPEYELHAVGTNAIATAAMLKAGADKVATGENPVLVACRTSDVIIGPIGIIITDSLMGEVTETMAAAVARSSAKKILLPFNHSDRIILGTGKHNIKELIGMMMEELKQMNG